MLKVWKLSLVVALAASLLVSTVSYAEYSDSSTVQLATNPTLGQILTDSNGMTLYVFAKDSAGVSNCTGGCLAAWPALTVSAGTMPTAGSGVTGTLGTITRSDNGALQVTYNGKPLYHFASDSAPGDTSGQGVGGVWSVASPLMAAGSATMTTPVALTSTVAAMAAPMITATIEVTTVATLGQILTDSNGMTLYVFAKDSAGVSNCTGGCLAAWPALTVPAGTMPTAGSGVTGTLGTITRSDNGALQVTYKGKPLYHFASDSAPGDTSGQGVGGVWAVARP